MIASTFGTGNAVASLRGVFKRYGDVQALDGLDLHLKGGEILALLGPNGAGKTTAVSLWLGLQRADRGAVELLGGTPREARVRARLGAMLQSAGRQSGLAPTLTVAELLDRFRAYYPRPASLGHLVRTADLDGLLGRRLAQLSGGQRQRVLFAVALAGDPDVVFLDEPSVALDLDSRHRLWDAVRRLAESGRSVLLTTHHLEEAAALADRVVVLDAGRAVAEGSPAQLEARVAGRRIRCVTRLGLERLRAFEHVRHAARRGAATEILTDAPEAVLRRLLADDPDLRELEVGGVGLEQAFLALTGRAPSPEDLSTAQEPSYV